MQQRLFEAGFDPDNPLIARVLAVTEQLQGHPRHLSQHVGGFVISDAPLHTVVPVENSLLFATELRRHHIPVEFHLFERGCHGLSLANELTDNPQGERIQRECECWITMAIAWMRNL